MRWPFAGRNFGQKSAPACGIDIQWLGRDRMVREAGDIRHFGGDPDIERGDVIVQHPPRAKAHLPGLHIQAHSAVKDQPRPGCPGQPDKVDIQILAPVVACDMSRQHARVGRGRGGVDHRHPHPGQRIHRPFPQHQRMRMATANQGKVAGQGMGQLHGTDLWSKMPAGLDHRREKDHALGREPIAAGDVAVCSGHGLGCDMGLGHMSLK